MMNLSLSSFYDSSELAARSMLSQPSSGGLGTPVGTQSEFDELYEVGGVLGRGTYSVVRAVRRRDTGEIFACKFVDKIGVQVNRMREEIRVLVAARHRNVVALHAVFETECDLRLIVDIVYGGELFDRIVEKKFYSEREAAEVVHSLLQAVAFLHDRHIVHRDIKPENILLASRESDTDIKLSDFGLAKIFEEESKIMSPHLGSISLLEDVEMDFSADPPGASLASGSHCPSLVSRTSSSSNYPGYSGAAAPSLPPSSSSNYPSSPRQLRSRAYTTLGTDYYIAPEILKGEGYGAQVDMWSVGVVMYILLCGFPPFVDTGGDVSNVYRKIRAGEYGFPSPYWDTVSDEAKGLVRRMLTVDPDARVSARQALGHPWIAARETTLPMDTPLSPHHASMFRKFHVRKAPVPSP